MPLALKAIALPNSLPLAIVFIALTMRFHSFYPGAKFRSEIYTAFENIYPILQV